MTTKENINTKRYWNNRFADKDTNSWKHKEGEFQTMYFAHTIVKRLKISKKFLDFSCALDNVIPIYKKYCSNASFVGVDFFSITIEQCREKFGYIATFICGDVACMPSVDVTITSNVLEHLSDNKNIAKRLLNKCKDLYISVLYNEKISEKGEYVNSYNEYTFSDLNNSYVIYLCRGYNLKRKWKSYFNVEEKNLLSPAFSKTKFQGGVIQQILFHITNNSK
ncbi:MAG: class I SAM-dependent methyltransferase [Bacteroidales bacterium]|jgi:2-polyprenyl-3-methyl-5-hydroxy-6-metoxy-1,4-benzoquinol methylase|nr:class I SAM-dependent methyltransferase [Bacteroidales bacterium]